MAQKLNIAGIGLLLILMILSMTVSCESEPVIPPTTTEEPYPVNFYNPEAFYTEDGFLRYKEAPHMIGMDVSVYQGVIDWQTVANSGVEFVIIRAGYRGSTQGLLYEDEQFRYNLQGAKEAGLKVGVYFFSQAATAEEAEEEADYVCSLLDGAKLDLPVFYDWEYLDGRTGAIETVPLTLCAQSFCERIEAEGYQAGVYFNQTYGKLYFDLRELQDYCLWLAEYNPTPSFPYTFDCLQYTDSGAVEGIEGSVDLDILWLPQ